MPDAKEAARLWFAALDHGGFSSYSHPGPEEAYALGYDAGWRKGYMQGVDNEADQAEAIDIDTSRLIETGNFLAQALADCLEELKPKLGWSDELEFKQRGFKALKAWRQLLTRESPPSPVPKARAVIRFLTREEGGLGTLPRGDSYSPIAVFNQEPKPTPPFPIALWSLRLDKMEYRSSEGAYVWAEVSFVVPEAPSDLLATPGNTFKLYEGPLLVGQGVILP